jgi:ribonucleoside-diphosphate reductase alpha chain
MAASAGKRLDGVLDVGPETQFKKFSGDAPFCDACGHTTVRNGTCFKCLNCGTSMGCS